MHPAFPLLLALTVQKAPPAPDTIWPDAWVAMTYPAPASCGIVMAWGAADFTHDGVTERVYVMCAMAENLPRPGARCSVRSYVGTIDAVPSDGRQAPFKGRIAAAMTCDPPIARPLT